MSPYTSQVPTQTSHDSNYASTLSSHVIASHATTSNVTSSNVHGSIVSPNHREKVFAKAFTEGNNLMRFNPSKDYIVVMKVRF